MIAQARGRAGRGELGRKTGKADLRCSVCGYGLIVIGLPPACPMCRERGWHAVSPTPRHERTSDGGAAMSAAASGAERRRGDPGRLRANVSSSDELPAGLDWQAFSARYFPGRYRHDLEALIAYGSYRRLPRVAKAKSLESSRDPVVSEEPERVAEAKSGAVVGAALQAWEEEGGAPSRARAARRRPSLDSRASSRRAG